jgi:hypothetical protein
MGSVTGSVTRRGKSVMGTSQFWLKRVHSAINASGLRSDRDQLDRDLAYLGVQAF